jgi:hypothetical protein
MSDRLLLLGPLPLDMDVSAVRAALQGYFGDSVERVSVRTPVFEWTSREF